MKYRPTEEAMKLLCELFARCVEISTKTDADVFLYYAPHCGSYRVLAHRNGWEIDREGEFFTKEDNITEITVENIKDTMAKLDELEGSNG